MGAEAKPVNTAAPDFERVKHFGPQEFSEDPVLYAEARQVYNLDQWREWLGSKAYPSKAEGGLARFSGDKTSRHRVILDGDNVVKRSDANDIFPELPQAAWLLAITCGLFGAVGLYTDTKGNNGQPWPMLHLDGRPQPGNGHDRPYPLLWHRHDGEYHYIQYHPDQLDRMIGMLSKWSSV